MNLQRHTGKKIAGNQKQDKYWCNQKDKFVNQTYYTNPINDLPFGRNCDECDDICTFECEYKRAQR